MTFNNEEECIFSPLQYYLSGYSINQVHYSETRVAEILLGQEKLKSYSHFVDLENSIPPKLYRTTAQIFSCIPFISFIYPFKLLIRLPEHLECYYEDFIMFNIEQEIKLRKIITAVTNYLFNTNIPTRFNMPSVKLSGGIGLSNKKFIANTGSLYHLHTISCDTDIIMLLNIKEHIIGLTVGTHYDIGMIATGNNNSGTKGFILLESNSLIKEIVGQTRFGVVYNIKEVMEFSFNYSIRSQSFYTVVKVPFTKYFSNSSK